MPDAESLDRALAWLLERRDALGLPADRPAIDPSAAMAVVAGAVAIEAARRWKNRRVGVASPVSWSSRESSLRGFF